MSMSLPRLTVNPSSLLAGAVKVLLAAAVIVALAPPLRQRVAPHAGPVLDPVRRLTVKDRVDRVSMFMEREIHVTGLTPQDRDLPAVVRKLFPGRDDTMMDPWGTRYYLRRRGDGFHVASAGPDRRRGTPDDVLSHKRALPSSAAAALAP
jgi:hypothetical protein